MLLISLFRIALLSGLVGATSFNSLRAIDLGSFVASETTTSLQGALNNVGPNGSLVAGAGNYVVASPSLVNPDYFFTWTRDSALTLKMMIDEFIFGTTSLQSQIEEYIPAQAILQTISNPSGTFLPDGSGLGEPKYMVDGTRFNEPWGRPQRDGPALRAIALMSYINWLIVNDQFDTAKSVVWPIVANDLAYVGQYWNQSGFDLWEETNGSSFFTIQNQHRSLVQGAQLATTLDVSCPACESQQAEILCFLQTFWNGEFIIANLNVDNGRSGLDANTILGPIAVFDVEAGCDGVTFQPCESKSLANFKVFTDTFRNLYTINAGIANSSGAAVGRYPEDVYMGGNPWYLITLAAAEFLYDAVAQWTEAGSLTIDSISLPFFSTIFPQAQIQTYSAGTSNSSFSAILAAVTTYADSFVAVVEQYIPENGALAEQFDRDTGVPVSAIDLTWSYASFVTMSRRRAGNFPASWGAKTAISPPDTCTGTSLAGTYTPATAAGAPNIITSCQVSVTFNLNATTYFGENIYLIGNTTELGAWDFANSDAMSGADFTAERPLWFFNIELAAGETVSYQYVRMEDCGQPNIFEDVNRTLSVPACGEAPLTLEDAWEGDVGTSGDC